MAISLVPEPRLHHYQQQWHHVKSGSMPSAPTRNPFPCYNPRSSSRTPSRSSLTRLALTLTYTPTSSLSPCHARFLHPIMECLDESQVDRSCHDIDVAPQGFGIDDEEYDCGYALNLGAEASPSASGPSTPGYTRSGSTPSYESSSSNSPSSPVQVAPSAPPVLKGEIYRGNRARSSADERLMREWAIAVAGKGEVDTPPAPRRRSRGSSLDGDYSLPPVSSSRNRSGSGGRNGGSNCKGGASSSVGATTNWHGVVDRDCGICFEYAVRPSRTSCCGRVFCKEHLEDVSRSLYS